MMGTVAATALLASGLLFAQEGLPDAKLDDWKIGKALVGEDVEKEDLKGKVVVIKYWGPG